jgi:predicted metal-dependent peptidase
VQTRFDHTLDSADNQFFQSMRFSATRLQPYLASAIFAMTPVASPGRGTFAVDRHWRLYLDMEMARTWGVERAAGVLLHEANHLLRKHHERGVSHKVSGATALTWNVACDIAINDDLISAGLSLPSPILPSTFGLATGDVEEHYYERLRRSETAPGVFSCGSGAGGPAEDNELDEQEASVIDDVDAFNIRQEVRIAISRSDPSNVPGGMTRWAIDTNDDSRIHWKTLLRGALAREAHSSSGLARATWTRSHRRSQPQDTFLKPGYRRLGLRIAVVLDTSGSIDQSLLDIAASELQGLLRTVRGGTLTLIPCDSQSHVPRQLKQASMIPAPGGGSTDLRVGISCAAEVVPSPDLIVVLTDGVTPWPRRAPERTRVIAVVISPRSPLPSGPGITAIRVHD